MSYLDIKCCKCGASYFTIRYSTSTAMWSPTIIKDGKVISSNPNYETHHCQCIACGAFFDVTEHNGVIESVEIERGFSPVTNVGTSINADEIRRKIDENIARWKDAADKMNEERILTIKKEVAELQTTLQNTTFNGAKLTYGNYKSSPNSCGK